MKEYGREEMKRIADSMTPEEAATFSDFLRHLHEARERFKNRISHCEIQDGTEMKLAEQVFLQEKRLIIFEAKKKLALFEVKN